mgnify:CR=1 FL=1
MKRAGRQGEKIAVSAIESILTDKDYLFTNVSFSYDNRDAELDCVIVNNYGVFIFEVKNYIGVLYGNEEDFYWEKYKTTDNGNIYEKTVKNPIPQVKREIYLFANYLKRNGVDVWIKGYAILVQENSPIRSDYILCSVDEIDKAVHTKDRTVLSDNTIEKIKRLIE